MKFKISLDKLAKVVTITTTLIFTSLIIGQLLLLRESVNSISFTTIFILGLIYFVVFLYRPLYYKITDGVLFIHRLSSGIKINLKNINNVQLIDKERLKGTIRIFGVSGLFGYWGKFHNSKIGTMTWYATRRNKMVLITTIDDKKIVVTPDEAELFVSELTALISN